MSIEAMKLALDALEGCYSTGDYDEYQFYDEDLVMPAITALRQAIKESLDYVLREQAQKQERTGSCPLEDCDGGPETHGCWAHNCEWKAQKQEPVSWIYEDELSEGYPYDAMFEKSRVIDGVRMFPVNVAPQRQPLTDEQLLNVYLRSNGLEFYKVFARNIEAAHGITGEQK